MAGRHVRIRHHNGATTRDTHGPPGYSAAIVAPPSVIQRDGEQQQLPDLGPGSVDTQQFYPTAKAPQVNNNPLEPTAANVTIDEEGLHVRDGAIFLEDYGGNSVLGPAGFDGSWVEFIHGGVYNGGFNAGITSWVVPGVTGSGESVAATTIVGTADTPADYAASLSAALPYWVVSEYVSTDDTMSAVILADSTDGRYLLIERLTGGGAVQGGTMAIMQDVPIVQERVYEMEISHQFSVGGAGAENSLISVLAQYRDSEHAALGSQFTVDLALFDPSSGTDQGGKHIAVLPNDPPVGAKYCRLTLRVQHEPDPSGAGRAVQIFDVSLREAPRTSRLALPADVGSEIVEHTLQGVSTGQARLVLGEPNGNFTQFQLKNDSDSVAFAEFYRDTTGGKIVLGSGSASGDVVLYRSAANTLSLASDSLTGIVTLEAANIEVRSPTAPFIDFSNDAGDFDARLILSADDVLELQSAALRIVTHNLEMAGGRIQKFSSDGWTVPLYDGDNAIAFKWDGTLKVKIDSTEFTITIT